MCACVCREKLHACILLDSRTSVSPNSISGICSRSTRNFVPSHFNLLRATPLPLPLPPRPSVPRGDTPFFPPLGGDSPNFSQAPRRCRGKERGIFIYRSLSVAKLLEHRARRGNTEYHRQTLISFCRGQIVPSRSNFRESSRALDRAAARRARIRADATSRHVGSSEDVTSKLLERGKKYSLIIIILSCSLILFCGERERERVRTRVLPISRR